MTQRPEARAAVAALAAVVSATKGEGRDEVLARLAEHTLDQVQAVHALQKPVTRFIPAVMASLVAWSPATADALQPALSGLRWLQSSSYTDAILGHGFTDNYAWAELIGPEGLFVGDDFTLGLLLLGPRRHYIDHYHPAPELYIPLTSGSLWKKGDSAFMPREPGELIWHPSMVIHATKTQDEPLMAIYSWTRDTATPAKLKLA